MYHTTNFLGVLYTEEEGHEGRIREILEKMLENMEESDIWTSAKVGERPCINFKGTGYYCEDAVYTALNELSPLIISASIEYVGDNCVHWKHEFSDGIWKEFKGEIVYGKPTELRVPTRKIANDVRLLKKIIADQNARGASLPIDLDHPCYGWNEEGKLLELNWCSCGLSGELSLRGLDNLGYVECSYNQLTSLDASGIAELTSLYCYNNRLYTLNVSGCRNLTTLECSHNRLEDLDVKDMNLVHFACSDNALAVLDVSGCNTLEWLVCDMNQLTALDISGCTDLKGIDCRNNPITSLIEKLL